MKVTAIIKECEIEDSKIFGEAYLPDEWLEKDLFSPFEFFLAQIDLSKFSCEFLPSNGYLYFFIDAYSLTEKKMKAKVRYYGGEPDAYTDFNDGYFDCDIESYLISNETELNVSKDLQILNLFEENGEEIKLLEIPTNLLPFELSCKKVVFIINKSILKNLVFDECRLVFIN